jgi:YVTN family beta-propeller protein
MSSPLLSRILVGSLFALTCSLAHAQEAGKAGGMLLVTNKGDQAMSIVDPATNKQIASVPEEGVTGHELAVTADGKQAVVPIFGNSGVGKPGTDGSVIQIIDLERRQIVKTIDFKRGVRPHHPVLCEKTGLIYVTTELEKSVSILDPAKMEITGSIPTGEPESHMLCVSKDGKRGYTANVGPGTVSVLDLENKSLLKVIPVARHTQRIALSVDDKLVFTADQTKPLLVVIDTEKNEVKSTIPLPDFGYGTAPTPDGKSLLVCIPNTNEVVMLDLATQKVVKSYPVVRAPQAVLVRPDGKVAYASCDASKQVAAIDLTTDKVELIDVGKGADGMAWAATK